MPIVSHLVAVPMPAAPYDRRFEIRQIAPSLRSARLFLGHLWRYLQPQSVIELGCGRGAWLKACHELGSAQLVGYDGHWNSGEMMVDGAIEFHGVDLNAQFDVPRHFDLAISMAVAQHLEPASAARFVGRLTTASNAVLFNAACCGQDGAPYLNDQLHSWWAALFAHEGYQPFDLFRSPFWGSLDLCYWSRQNTFLYAAAASVQHCRLRDAGARPLEDTASMDRVLPALYVRNGGAGKLSR
jgi:SAM-dependent methyltransferase